MNIKWWPTHPDDDGTFHLAGWVGRGRDLIRDSVEIMCVEYDVAGYEDGAWVVSYNRKRSDDELCVRFKTRSEAKAWVESDACAEYLFH